MVCPSRRSLHQHFNRDHFILMYEITAKMAADIHTKGFRNPLAWKKAQEILVRSS